MQAETVLQQKRDEIQSVAARYGARNVRVFGSVARGEAGPDSDIDLDVVWAVVERDLPLLKPRIEEILRNMAD